MEWVSGWIQGIIIAVIISTIIEMILPEGTSKKYIKVVIGVYILFSMISPVINKLTGNNFRVSDILDLDEYVETSKNSESLKKQLSNQNKNQIKEIYLSSMKSDIKEKIESKGYTVNSVEIEVEDDEQYTLKKISLQVAKGSNTNSNETETKKTNQIVENVNKVQIQVEDDKSHSTIQNSKEGSQQSKNDKSKTKKDDISNQNKKELKEYLSGVYEISIKNIFINE